MVPRSRRQPVRNVDSYQKANEYEGTGTDHNKQAIEGDLDL